MELPKRLGVNLGWFVVTVLAVTMVRPATAVAATAESRPAPEVVRRFRAEVVAVDAGGRTVTLLHAPSGYRFTAQITDKTRLTQTRFYDPAEIAAGTVMETWGQIDTAAGRVRAGECRAPATPPNLIARPEQNYIAGRLFRQPAEQPEAEAWMSADRKAVLGLETADGRRWRLIRWKAPPVAFCHSPATSDAFRVGGRVEAVVADRGGHGELREAVVDVWFAGAENRHALGRCLGNGPSGMTAAQFAAQLQAVKQRHAQIAGELARLMPVRLDVSPPLALVGEPVRLEIRVCSPTPPQPKTTVHLDYFHTNMAQSRDVMLVWKKRPDEHGVPVYEAEAELPATKVGQYLVEWNCDVGGDIAKYSRSYAVCDHQSAVCQFTITSPGSPHPEIDFHKHHVPFDYWQDIFFDLPRLAQAGAADWAQRSRRAREFGDTPDFLFEWYTWDTAQVCREPVDVQRLAADAIKPLARMQGFTERPISVWSYTLGNAGYRLLQQAGELTVTSLCTENHVDGGLEINHWGKPERPYFISPEDFRKVGPGGPDRLVAFSQVQRHTHLARHYFCNYCIEGACFGLAEPAWSGRGSVVDELAMSRMLDGFDSLFQMARSQKTPYTIATGVEFNGGRPGATEANRIELDYAVAKARAGNVVFATSRGLAQFYRRHYRTTPESTAYFHDYWAGTHQSDKPDLCPDVMTMEGPQLSALALEGQILPECQYDYTQPWDYPDFGNDQLPRRLRDAACYLLPGKFDKWAATPRTVDTRPFLATRSDHVTGDALEVTVQVKAAAARKNLALALWNVPREFRQGDGWFRTSANCRFVPLQAPYSGNLNGFLVADVAQGTNRFSVRFTSPVREPKLLDFTLGASVRGKVFCRNGQTMAYLWPTGPWAAEIQLDLPAGSAVRAYVAPEGAEQRCRPGKSTVTIAPEQWARLVGLEREDILRYATAAHR